MLLWTLFICSCFFLHDKVYELQKFSDYVHNLKFSDLLYYSETFSFSKKSEIIFLIRGNSTFLPFFVVVAFFNLFYKVDESREDKEEKEEEDNTPAIFCFVWLYLLWKITFDTCYAQYIYGSKCPGKIMKYLMSFFLSLCD